MPSPTKPVGRALRVGWRWQLTALVMLASVPFAALVIRPTAAFYGAWIFYDLAQTVFGDFYHPFVTTTFREVGGYSQSFPPLWPVLIAIVDRILRWGPATQVLLAVVSVVLLLLPFIHIAQAMVRHRTPAIISATLSWTALISFADFRAEVRAGHPTPLAVLLVVTIVACLINDEVRRKPGRAALTGVLLGLCCLARFDALLFAVVTVIGFCCLPRTRWVCKVAIVVSFVIAISPWVGYSLAHYGSPWASDNSFVALSAHATHVSVYDAPQGTLLTEPGRWAVRIAGNGVVFVLRFLQVVLAVPLLLVALSAAAQITLTRGRERVRMRPAEWRVLLMIAVVLVGMAAQVLTGYFDMRYFSTLVALLLLWSMAFVVRRVARRRLLARTAATCLAVVALVNGWSGVVSVLNATPSVSAEHEIQLLQRDYRSAVILERSTDCAEVGARARVHLVCAPQDWTELSPDAKRRFVRELGITHISVAPPTGQPDSIVIVPARDGIARELRARPPY